MPEFGRYKIYRLELDNPRGTLRRMVARRETKESALSYAEVAYSNIQQNDWPYGRRLALEVEAPDGKIYERYPCLI